MFDCGPAATHKRVKAGLWPTKGDQLFFTHHHFDHDVDYPAFLLCRWDQSIGKENPLRVYGPTLTESITEKLVGEHGAFAHDWKARVGHPLSQRVFVNRGGTLPRPPLSTAYAGPQRCGVGVGVPAPRLWTRAIELLGEADLERRGVVDRGSPRPTRRGSPRAPRSGGGAGSPGRSACARPGSSP